MSLFQESARKLTQVSAKLASHIFSKQFPKTNVFFSPLSVHYMLNKLAKDNTKGRTLRQLLDFLKIKTKDENDSMYAHFDNVLSKGRSAGSPGCFEIRYNTLHMTRVGGGGNTALQRPRCMNDLYARGGWFEQFDCSEIKESEFHVSDGEKVNVLMMSKEKLGVLYGEYDGFKVVGFPHFRTSKQEDTNFTVYVFLPDEKEGGLKSLVERIGATSDDFFDNHIPDQKAELREICMPMFQVFSEFDIAPSLKELGLQLPFSGEHGTPDMFDPSEGQNMCILGVHQNYGFSLTMKNKKKKKTTSAAAVDVESGEKKKMVDFVVDRPFLFVMKDEVSKAVFFMGQMIDPSVKVDKMWYPNSVKIEEKTWCPNSTDA